MPYTHNGVEYTLQSKDLAARFNYTDARVRELSRQGKIPHIKIGRRFWYNLEQAQAAIVTSYPSTINVSEVSSVQPDDLEDLLAGI